MGERATDRLRRISLTEGEEALVAFLVAANTHMGLGQTIRIAGGWVRDKLLGESTDDIDVTLDSMTGQRFVDGLRRYTEKHRRAGVGAAGERLPPGGLGRGYLVQQNVERSKHLETAGVSLFGFKVEFVHLRSETYAEGSRVPLVEFGGPETDARRRDLTINALFWRLNTRRVEDLVGGIEDLERLRLRTPMEPVRTFIDDPLRVLRVMRFRSRFETSTIDEATLSAMGEREVRRAYQGKVAPERAAAEIVKLFAGSAPGPALTALDEAGMAPVVFGVEALEDGELAVASAAAQHTADRLSGASPTDRAMTGLCVYLDVGLRSAGVPPERVGRTIERALKRIGIGKPERAMAHAIRHGSAACLADAWNDSAIGELRLATRVPGNEREDVWRLAFAAASAEARAREDRQGIGLGNRAACGVNELERRLNETSESMRDAPPLDPILGGDEIMRMFPGLNPRTGFIREVQDRLVRAQLRREVRTVAAAREFVEGCSSSIRSSYGSDTSERGAEGGGGGDRP